MVPFELGERCDVFVGIDIVELLLFLVTDGSAVARRSVAAADVQFPECVSEESDGYDYFEG